MHKGGKKFLLECKRYAAGRTSGRPELQKFHSAIMTDKADRGLFITTGGFTTAAKKFAASEPIDLVSGQTLLKIMAVAVRKEGDLSIDHLLIPEEAPRKARRQSRRWRRY
jgi:restriction endonuclease Mrr